MTPGGRGEHRCPPCHLPPGPSVAAADAPGRCGHSGPCAGRDACCGERRRRELVRPGAETGFPRPGPGGAVPLLWSLGPQALSPFHYVPGMSGAWLTSAFSGSREARGLSRPRPPLPGLGVGPGVDWSGRREEAQEPGPADGTRVWRGLPRPLRGWGGGEDSPGGSSPPPGLRSVVAEAGAADSRAATLSSTPPGLRPSVRAVAPVRPPFHRGE